MQQKLTHVKLKDGSWVWICPICKKQFGKHISCSDNYQSKGAASRHLMTHGYDLVKHHQLTPDLQPKTKEIQEAS